jgi:hypothetical protein
MATKKDLVIDQGSRFNVIIAVTGISDMTGYSARGMVRARATDSTVLLDLGNYLSVDAVNKQVTIDMPGSASDSFTWDHGVYDIEVYNPTPNPVPVYRILQGGISLDKQVTH